MLYLKDGSPPSWRVWNSSQILKLFVGGEGRKMASWPFAEHRTTCFASCRYSWPIVATTNGHYWLSGLKRHKFIILQFWRSEVQNGSSGAKIKVPAGLRFFLEALWKSPFLCLFQLLEDAHVPPASKPAMSGGVVLTSHHPDLLPSLPLPHLKAPWLHWAHLDNPGYAPYF